MKVPIITLIAFQARLMTSLNTIIMYIDRLMIGAFIQWVNGPFQARDRSFGPIWAASPFQGLSISGWIFGRKTWTKGAQICFRNPLEWRIFPSPSSSTSIVHDPLALGDWTCASRVVGTSTDMRCVCIVLLYFFWFEELFLSINRHQSVPSVVNAAVPPPLTVPIRILSLPPIPKSPPPVPGELADIDNASAEELRQALKIRNEQYKDLVRFVVRMSEIHTAAADRFRITPAETREAP